MKAHKCNLESHRAILSFFDLALFVRRHISPVTTSTKLLCRLERAGNDRFTTWTTARKIVSIWYSVSLDVCPVTCYRYQLEWSCVTVSELLASSRTVGCVGVNVRWRHRDLKLRIRSYKLRKLAVVDRTEYYFRHDRDSRVRLKRTTFLGAYYLYQ